MKIFVLNSRRYSIEYQLFNMDTCEALTYGVVEQIGEPLGRIKYKWRDANGELKEGVRGGYFEDHAAGLTRIFEITQKLGIINDISDIDGFGHRVLHGGESVWKPSLITKRVINAIEEMIPLGPLHNPANLKGIYFVREAAPDTPQVAVFDTAFGQTMPPYAFHYALPHTFYRDLHIRRYGFHGTSHFYVSKQAALLLDKPHETCNLITLHLGTGSSCAAIKNGKCVDTSMGLTPLEGLLMGTRCGDLDPAIVPFIGKNLGLSYDQLDSILNKESGLKGICGTNDMREIESLAASGNVNARLAIEMFCYRIKKYIGSYYAALNRVDAIAFAGGIGENATSVRKLACSELEHLGIIIDEDRNNEISTEAREISADNSEVKIFVIPTDEELEIAQQTLDVINRQQQSKAASSSE
jgi:acetate kinase